ncbi:MAG: S41 family peptidase [Acidobacteriia bacterium]|nr:S41 family peptidase [Terriglobia bacterium]
MLAKKPIVLEAEGLGPRRFHGRAVLLVNRHTASAAGMIVAFARENSLATMWQTAAGQRSSLQRSHGQLCLRNQLFSERSCCESRLERLR